MNIKYKVFRENGYWGIQNQYGGWVVPPMYPTMQALTKDPFFKRENKNNTLEDFKNPNNQK